ncbi:hypothetical protein ACFVYE_35650 [Streptomyces sp. NPDC058239]|uniref:hypothetical protein n=1 Tax=Streptomyces sp. NPDC058239 TaxID=3346395 RepID=UPI0036EB1BE4
MIASDLAALQKPLDLLSSVAHDVSSPEGHGALQRRREPLDVAQRSLVARVEALEACARRVRAVDAALAEAEALHRLASDDSALDALSRISGNNHAHSLDAGSTRNLDTRAALAEALDAARTAAGRLSRTS